MILLHPTYFGPISHYIMMFQHQEICFEVADNFQKQTYRNRSYIYGANGKLLLNIPVKHNKSNGRQKTKEVLIDNDFHWQKNHFKTFQNSYRSSPYFEFYEDDLAPLYHKTYTHLLDFNLKTHEFIIDALQEKLKICYTSDYEIESKKGEDYRFLVEAKKEKKINLTPYTQVFDDKFGFISNLSILDLLFMEGPNALNYLENQQISF
ncbi:MAG: WbqC family protein [Flavobacteriaceae bacterium]|nr:WbqC family protein [Flavobacteriaceae bacterium]